MVERKIKSSIIRGLENSRIILINGPRQCGKTTLVKQIAGEMGMQYITLDDPRKLDLAKNDPENFISHYKYPLVIDEIQYAPELIPYLKQSVDNINQKGMYLLTGSSDFYKSVKITESLAGRMLHYVLNNFSVTEINGYKENVIDLLFDPDITGLKYFTEKQNNKDYKDVLQRIIIGGFPEIQEINDDIRKIWFESYINARILKDVEAFFDIRRENKIYDLLQLLAGQNANLINNNSLSKIMKLDFKTVQKYILVLESMFLIKQVSSFSRNVNKNVIKQKKIHFTDTGLAASILNINLNSLIDNDRNMLGQFLENFVFTELLKENSFSRNRANIFHFRDLHKNEVDFILENHENRVLALEVKAKSIIRQKDLSGVFSFAKALKSKPFRIYVFYSGNELMPIANRENLDVYLVPMKIFA